MSRFNAMHRFWIALGLLGLAACGLTAGPQFGKVAVRVLQTDILFGARQTPASPKPPSPPPLPGAPDFSLPDFNFGSFTLPSQDACPAAGPTTFPAEVAGTTPDSLPATGAYRWRLDGAMKEVILGSPVTLPLKGLDMPMYVRRATQIASPTNGLPGTTPSFDYTYQTIWDTSRSGGGYLVYSWKVKSNGVSASSQGVTASDPEAGVSLQEVDYYDKSFQNMMVLFHPRTGLLLLPLPVVTGTTWNSTASDPTSGVATFAGTTGTRVRVDACGQPIEGWEATGTLTLAGTFGSVNPNSPLTANPTQTPQANLEIVDAPQYGGLIIQFKIDGAWFGGLDFVQTTIRDGQLNPDPLDKKYQ